MAGLTEGELGHLQGADPGLLDGRGERTEHSREERGPPRPAGRGERHFTARAPPCESPHALTVTSHFPGAVLG